MIQASELLPQRLAQYAAERPGDVIQQDVAGGCETYAQVHDAILRWATVYRDLGVGAGDTVVTMQPSSLESAHTWLGAAWLRAIEVPMNTMYRGDMLQYVVNNTLARVMVIAERFLDEFLAVADHLDHLETVLVLDPSQPLPTHGRLRFLDGGALARAAAPAEGLIGPEPHDIACMIYTSGTTGPSKGVLMPWREFYEFPSALPPDTCAGGSAFYVQTPMFHVSGRSGLWCAAYFGSRMVLREHFSVSHFWDDIRTYHCGATLVMSSMATLLLRAEPKPDDADNPLAILIVGPLIPEVDEFCERFGVRIETAYGMTEIGLPLAASCLEIPNTRTCGKVRPGYELRIVDEHDNPRGPGVVGELILRTDEPWMLNAGYWNMPEATATAWRNGWFHTGDGFQYDEAGFFYFVDRIKDALRRRGENISSFEVEAIVNQHPAVRECAAIAVPSDLTEDDVKIVVAKDPDSDLDAEALFAFLVERMPKFMLPRYIEFMDELPRVQTTLKVKKADLRRDPVNANTWDAEVSVAEGSS